MVGRWISFWDGRFFEVFIADWSMISRFLKFPSICLGILAASSSLWRREAWRAWFYQERSSKINQAVTHRIHGMGVFTDRHFPLFMWPFFTFHVGKYSHPMDPMGVINTPRMSPAWFFFRLMKPTLLSLNNPVLDRPAIAWGGVIELPKATWILC